MRVKPNPIYIAFTFDRNYLIPFYVSITSICINCKWNYIIFHIITSGIDEDDEKEIKKYLDHFGAQIYFHDFDNKNVAKYFISDDSYFTSTIFYRLFIPLLVPPEVLKIIYLDTDTISIKDLSYLYNIPLNNNPVGAINDIEMYQREDIGILDKNDYFNSGVLLINVIEWRTQNITEKAIEFLLNNPKGCKFPDQDALNVVLRNNWLKLEQKYNVMKIDISSLGEMQVRNYILNKVIIHYNDDVKPWMKGVNHSLKYLFMKYYVLFSNYEIGKAIINKNLKNQLTHLILTDLIQEDDDLETRIQLGFSLHLCFIDTINDVYIYDKYLGILREVYNKLTAIESDSVKKHFDSEFENNKAILFENYEKVMLKGSSKKNNSSDWIRKWKIYCEMELVALKNLSGKSRINKLDELAEIPDWINKQLKIPKVFAKLLYYFIDKIMNISKN